MTIEQSYPAVGIDHYENFPVASWVLPGPLRAPVRAIYAFARQADDFADEGSVPNAQRLASLSGFSHELDRIEAGRAPELPLFRELARHVRAHELPLGLFRDLLSAFSQDVVKQRYADFAEVMDYCRRSANPIGRLLLHLYGERDPRSLAYSDGICSSLQLINFLQDIAVDFRKGRVYLPQDELARYGVSEQQIAAGDTGGAWEPMMRHQVERARRILQAGAPLGLVLNGRIGMELRMIVVGGERILRKLHRSKGDVFRQRPVLNGTDWAVMFGRALVGR